MDTAREHRPWTRVSCTELQANKYSESINQFYTRRSRLSYGNEFIVTTRLIIVYALSVNSPLITPYPSPSQQAFCIRCRCSPEFQPYFLIGLKRTCDNASTSSDTTSKTTTTTTTAGDCDRCCGLGKYHTRRVESAGDEGGVRHDPEVPPTTGRDADLIPDVWPSASALRRRCLRARWSLGSGSVNRRRRRPTECGLTMP